MGSHIELNDTLQVTTEQGFPVDILNLAKHQQRRIMLEDIGDRVFTFHKPKARIFHVPPTRNFLVQNIDDRWLYWGKIMMLEQTITSNANDVQTTSGKFRITELYDPEYQKLITQRECPEGVSYFQS